MCTYQILFSKQEGPLEKQDMLIFVTGYPGIKFGLFSIACLQLKANVTYLKVGYPGLMLGLNELLNYYFG